MANPDEHIAVRVGDWVVEYAVRDDNTMPAREFVDSLPLNIKHRILAAFRHVAEVAGRSVPPTIFKHERGELFTFKSKCQNRRIRLPCFRQNNRWIVTHGFFKPPRPEWPEQEFTLAFQIMKEVLGRETRLRKH